jgi:hypothetical protein
MPSNTSLDAGALSRQAAYSQQMAAASASPRTSVPMHYYGQSYQPTTGSPGGQQQYYQQAGYRTSASSGYTSPVQQQSQQYAMQYSPNNPYAAAATAGYNGGGYQAASGQPRFSRSSSSGGSDCGSDTDSQASDSSIEIVPRVRSEADGYNQHKTPSGNVVCSVSGQQIEFFCGVHIPQSAVRDGSISPGFSQAIASSVA